MEELKAKLEERDRLEKEIAELVSVLTGPGGLGFHGGLIDKEGFPISDVEKIISTRQARNQLAMKRNDLRDLSELLEYQLLDLHARAKAEKEAKLASQTTPSASTSTSTFTSTSTSSTSTTPSSTVTPTSDSEASSTSPSSQPSPEPLPPAFARVNSVAPSSPASESGMREGDLVFAFSSVTASNHNNLKAIPTVVKEGMPITVRVVRPSSSSPSSSEVVRLSLLPRKWEGRGLLGCHLLPIKK
eukprot:TRINITY_DN7923_c0_g1_i1.p1 TRINITY_DN7923_c0_g1~~TRINITY_DN7923_c0_g1_i1.p1  ORF type:complete len:265 (+),score=70.65 TRINITY_DN7923_c0_g1_i1:64-795(+)